MDLIYSYSRKQALEDGVLIDVTALATEAGFQVPVAITQELHSTYIKTNLPDQDEQGRLWDTLFLLSLSAKGSPNSVILYDVIFRMDDGSDQTITLRGVIGPNDDGSACVTVMLIHES